MMFQLGYKQWNYKATECDFLDVSAWRPSAVPTGVQND